MAENLRTGFVWKTFMQNPEPVAAMKMVGFESTITPEQPNPDAAQTTGQTTP